MKNKKCKLKELFSRFLEYIHTRNEDKEITQEELDELYQMLEDYKKKHGL